MAKMILRFAVSSDAHIKEAGDRGSEKFGKMLRTAYALADADSAYKKLDAVVMAGDLADKGTKEQFRVFKSVLEENLRNGTEFIGVVARRHDCDTDGRKTVGWYSELMGQPADTHTVINGFHFIALSVSPDETVHYSDEQKKWLDEQLAAAVADDPAKPVFLFQHEHIKYTVYGSLADDGWGEIYLTDIIKKYTQVVDISGHSHYPANDPRAVWQGEFTALNDGGLAYFEFTVDGQNKIRPENRFLMAQFLLVEVFDDNSVKIGVHDLTQEQKVREFYLKAPADPSSFVYSHDQRRKNAVPPVFPEDAALIAAPDGETVRFTAPPAAPAEDDVVFLYRFEIKDAEGNTVRKETRLSDYYVSAVPQQVTFTTENIGTGYTALLYAEDAWGKLSEPLSAVIPSPAETV